MIKEFKGEYSWLSNFAPVEVKLDGIKYPSVENGYQAAKTNDFEQRKQFETCTAAQAKKYGKSVTMWDHFEIAKVIVMHSLLQQKYAQEPYKSLLLATGDKEIQEGNWWGDTFWGICKGRGENLLGELIMGIRSDLKE